MQRWVGLSLVAVAVGLLAGCQHGTESARASSEAVAATESRAGETMVLAGGVPLELVWIPEGSFRMGQNPDEQDAYPNKETPQHDVTISKGFLMGVHEVTQEQWKAVMGTTPWAGKPYVNTDPKSPAVYITWDDAQAFVEKLSRDTGKSFRLPTEAEWEYACRAGTSTRFYWGDDPAYESIGNHAWWRGNALVTDERYARRVGLKPPNPWGLYDMSGNVSEWCQDWHSYYPDYACTDPVGPTKAEYRALRGGSWVVIGGRCRSSRRHRDLPSAATNDNGFRVVCGPAPQREPGSPVFTDVFAAGQDGVNTYRIPSMLIAPDGSLLVFCEARKVSEADNSPTDMVLRRSLDGGQTWLPTQVLARGVGAEALMNPCPLIDRSTNTIFLVCSNVDKNGPFHHLLYILTSKDSGQTWSEPVVMQERIANYDDSFLAGPGVGLQMKNGRLVVPGYSGAIRADTDEDFRSRVMYSDDHGKTWTMGATLPELTDESQAVELKDGRLMLNARGNMGMGCRGVAVTDDGGATWSSFKWDHQLNECPCQGSIVRYSFAETEGKDRLLFANPDNRGETFNVVERTKMTVRMSYDEGETWPVKKLVYGGPASYSGLVRLPDGGIAVLFEGGERHRREWIRFARFSLDWLTDGKDRIE